MSQTAVFIEIDGRTYPEVFYGIPDRENLTSLVADMYEDELSDFDMDPSCEFDVNVYWYDIGDGESGVDNFFSDDELLKMWNSGKFETMIESKGYSVECISDETETIRAWEAWEFDDDIREQF